MPILKENRKTVNSQAAVAGVTNPRGGITGVLTPQNRWLVDWLAFTLPYDEGELFVQSWLSELSPRRGGFRGYTHSMNVYETGVIAWSPKDQRMGYHVDLPGSALDLLLNAASGVRQREVSTVGFLARIMTYEAKLTRLDVALDDFSGQVQVDQCWAAWRSGRVTSRWRSARLYQGCEIGKPLNNHGVSFGSGRGESYLRIYDKRLERLSVGEVPVDQLPAHWVRCELELRGTRAQAMGLLLLENGRDAREDVASAIYGYLDFKDRGSSDRRERWPTVYWWAEFVGGVGKLHLGTARGESSDQARIEWLQEAVAGTLAWAEGAYGSEIVDHLLRVGDKKMAASLKAKLREGGVHPDSRLNSA